MTPLHYSIKSKLLPICMEINGKARNLFEVKDKPKEKQARDLLARINASSKGNNIAQGSQMYNFMRDCLASALDLPQLLPKTEDYFQPLSVIRDIVSEDPAISFLVIHGQQKYGLGLVGQEYIYSGKCVLATDEEIESCLDNLTSDQLKYILRSPVFEPFLADLFEQTTELVPESTVMTSEQIAEALSKQDYQISNDPGE